MIRVEIYFGSLIIFLEANYQLFLESEWAIDSEATRERGIIAVVKSN